MHKQGWAGLIFAAALGLSLAGCKDTKTLQENEQLKAQVAQLQKENGQLGNNLEQVTAARDALAKENETLKAKLTPSKAKRAKTSTTKRRRATKQSKNPRAAGSGPVAVLMATQGRSA